VLLLRITLKKIIKNYFNIFLNKKYFKIHSHPTNQLKREKETRGLKTVFAYVLPLERERNKERKVVCNVY
jgi:hypothetical protein